MFETGYDSSDQNSEKGKLEALETESPEQQPKSGSIKETVEAAIFNVNAALVNVLVSIPTTLSITMAMNYHAKKDEMVNPTLGILTLAFGFFMSFLVSGGTQLFKAFTATQAFILIMQVRKFGAACLPWTCIMTGFLLFLIVLLQIQKFIKITPNCVLSGLKFATGTSILTHILKGFC